jgi:hypothetical protein
VGLSTSLSSSGTHLTERSLFGMLSCCLGNPCITQGDESSQTLDRAMLRAGKGRPFILISAPVVDSFVNGFEDCHSHDERNSSMMGPVGNNVDMANV